MMPSQAEIEAEITRQITARGADKTICPSEVARALAQDWRDMMPDVRNVSDQMAARGAVVVTQRGMTVAAQDAVGPIRLGLPNPQEPD